MGKKFNKTVIFILLVSFFVTSSFFGISSTVFAEETQAVSIVNTGTGSSFGSYYVVYEYKGNQYRSDEIGPAMNRALWKKLNDSDKETLNKTLYDYGDKLAQFGKEGAEDILDWNKSTNQWSQAKEEWQNRIMNKYYPDIDSYYSKDFDEHYPDIDLFQDDTGTQLTCSDKSLMDEYEIKSTKVSQAWSDGKAAYGQTKKLKTSQITYATNVGSQAIIKLLLDGFFTPHATRGASVMSDALAQAFDFTKSTYENLANSDPSPSEVIAAIEKVLDKFANVARSKKQEVEDAVVELEFIIEDIKEQADLDYLEWQELGNERDQAKTARNREIQNFLSDSNEPVADSEVNLPEMPEEPDVDSIEQKKSEIQGKLDSLKSKYNTIVTDHEALTQELEDMAQAALDRIEADNYAPHNNYGDDRVGYATAINDLGTEYVDYSGEIYVFDPIVPKTNVESYFGSHSLDFLENVSSFYNQTQSVYNKMIQDSNSFKADVQGIIDFKTDYYERYNEIIDIRDDIDDKKGVMYNYYLNNLTSSDILKEMRAETNSFFKEYSFEYIFREADFEKYYTAKNYMKDNIEYYTDIADNIIPENKTYWEEIYNSYCAALDAVYNEYAINKANYENALSQMSAAVNNLNDLYADEEYFLTITEGTVNGYDNYFYDGGTKYAKRGTGSIDMNSIKARLSNAFMEDNYEETINIIKNEINNIRFREGELINLYNVAKGHAEYYESNLQYIFSSLAGSYSSQRHQNVEAIFDADIKSAAQIKENLLTSSQVDRISIGAAGSNVSDAYDMLLGKTDNYWELKMLVDEMEDNISNWQEDPDINYEDKVKEVYQSAEDIYTNYKSSDLTEAESGINSAYIEVLDALDETGVDYTAPIEKPEADYIVEIQNCVNKGNNSVEISARVNPNILETDTEYGFIWTDDIQIIMNVGYYLNSEELNMIEASNINSETGKYDYLVTELEEGQTYYALAYAVNNNALSLSNDREEIVVSNDLAVEDLKLHGLSVVLADETYSLSPAETSYYLSVPYSVDNVTVTASVYDNDNLLYINDSEVTVTGEVYGTGSLDVPLFVGPNQISVELIAEDLSQEIECQLNITREEDYYNPEDEDTENSNNRKSSNSSNNDDTDENDKITNNIVTEKTEQGTKASLEIGTEEFKKIITDFSDNEVVKLEIKDTDAVNVNLKGKSLQDLANKRLVLETETSYGSLSFESDAIDLQEISKSLGENVNLEEVNLSIEINKSVDNSFKETVTAGEEKGEYKVFVQPVEYKITASHEGKTAEYKKFNAYVTKRFILPDDYQPGQSVTGVIVSDDGGLKPAPTKIEEVDGVYYVVVKTMTNSVYSVISLTKSFEDIKNHWSKSAVEDMASRMIINGVDETNFKPDRNITRGEFATLIVRSLGLEESDDCVFSDINEEDWYKKYISTAYAYEITNGYTNGSFKPMKSISREEAFKMVVSAVKLAKIKTEIKAEEIEKELSMYSDGENVADWAEKYLTYCTKKGLVVGYDNFLRPQENITRAESVVLLKRMLDLMNLI